jgi:hypothetical protein
LARINGVYSGVVLRTERRKEALVDEPTAGKTLANVGALNPARAPPPGSSGASHTPPQNNPLGIVKLVIISLVEG